MTVFDGVRILDVTRGLAGPMSTMLLGDFGAEVIRIEPTSGDPARHTPGYLVWNRNKIRHPLDIDQPEGRAGLDQLIAGADIVVFDHAPGRLQAMGLDAETLIAKHPRLIHAWTPPFGVSGPYSHLPAHHGMLTGLTGTAFRQGSYGDQPVWHVMPMIHYGQATMAASAMAAALLDRIRTGEGQAIIVSGAHGNAEISGPIGLLDAPGMMQGHPLGGSASYRLYQCGDGEWLFLGTLFPHFFQKAIDALGLNRLRQVPPGAVDVGDIIAHVFAQQPRAHWLDLLRDHDVPAAPVRERADWLKSGPMGDTGMRVVLDDPVLGPVEMPGVSLKLADTPGAVRRLMRPATPQCLQEFASPRVAPAAAGPDTAPRPPLAGVKVLDLGSVIAGAYASSILANFGADVIKVESADGDPFRPYGTGFVNYNRGKRGLGLDLKDPEGRAVFLDMARHADVVIDNYRLGVRKRLGIDYEALAAVNPRIISCSINAYGSVGAEAHLPGFDPLLQARSGMMSAQGGGPGHEPVFHSVAINDVATAAMVSFGVIAALNARAVTGRGQNVETCLAASSAMFQSGDLTTWPGAPAPPIGEQDCIGFAALDRYYPCADGWLTLALTTEAQADTLAQVLGADDWRPRFGDALLAQPRRGALAEEIEMRLCDRGRDETVAALLAAGVPATPVFHGDEARGQEWLWEAGFFELRSDPMWGELVTSRAFAEFSRGGSGFSRLHPELGEHCVEVLLEYGIDKDRIRSLAEKRLIFRG